MMLGFSLIGQLVEFIWRMFMRLREMGDEVMAVIIDWAEFYVPSVNWAPFGDILANINYVFPLGEALALLATYFAFWTLVVFFRMVKSWIPWVGN